MILANLRAPRLLLLIPLIHAAFAFGQENTPAVDDEQAVVRRFVSDFEDAVRAYDTDRWASLMAEDVVMMSPSGRMLEGRTAFRSFWERAFAGQSGSNPLSITVNDTLISDGLIAVRAHYGPDGQDPVGQYVWMLARQPDGVWQLKWWIFNRRPPPPDA